MRSLLLNSWLINVTNLCASFTANTNFAPFFVVVVIFSADLSEDLLPLFFFISKQGFVLESCRKLPVTCNKSTHTKARSVHKL